MKRLDWRPYLATVLLTSALAVLSLQLWAVDLRAPMEYHIDALAIGAHFKTIIETGWYEYQPLLGAPFGQTYHDYPTADNLHFVIAKVIALFTHEYPVVLNVSYLIGFPLIAASALWFLRYVGVGRVLAVVLSALYAIAPYHFQRGEAHLFLANYFVLPLGLAIVVMAIRGERLWGLREHANRFVAVLTGPSARTIAIALLVGSAQAYYAVFTLLLLAFAGVFRLIRDWDWRRFLGAAAAGVAVVIVMAANMAPDVISSLIRGPDPGALSRSHLEAEVYALKLTQLILPWPGHRIGPLAELRRLYDTGYPLPSESPALGMIATAGLVILLLLAAYRVFAGSARKPAVRELTSRLGQLGALTLVAFLFATLGGLSTVISFVTTSIRGWNRMSIVIALFCLAAVGLLLDVAIGKAARRFSLRRTGTAILSIVTAGVLVVVGYVDQTPANSAAAAASAKAAWAEDGQWVAQLEQRVPSGGIVLQLPYLPYPEYASLTAVLSNDTIIPYLHSDTIRWSGGGIKGRPTADWPGALETLPGGDIATLAAAAGVSGIVVDRRSEGAAAARLEEELEVATRDAPLVSASGRYTFFDLQELGSTIAADVPDATLEQVAALVFDPLITSTPEFTGALDTQGGLVLTAQKPQGAIVVTSDHEEGLESNLRFIATTDITAPADELTVQLPDGTTKRYPFEDGVATVDLVATFPGGTSQVLLDADGKTITLTGLSLIPEPLRDFLRDRARSTVPED